MKNSVKRYIKVLVYAGIFTGVFSINSCNKDDNPSGMESGEYYPLAIGEVSLVSGSGKFSTEKTKSSIEKFGCVFSSDSSICFCGCSSWDCEKDETAGNVQTDKNIIRSSEDNLKSKGIGIFRLSGKGYPSAQNNIHYAYNYDESDWIPTDKSNPVYLDKDVAKLCAYYPYNSNLSNGNLTLTSQLYSDDADFCYQTGKTASSESGDVSFTLNHAYAKITFIFKREESYRGNGAVSKISISGENILSSNTLDIKTGSYGSGISGAVTFNPGISSIPSGGTASTEMLLVPVEQLTDKITFTFTIDGSESVGVFSPLVDEFNKFEAGKNYAIKIDIATSFVIVSGETANCYMLAPGKSIGIPIDVKGNGNPNAVAETGLDVHHTAKSVGIIWETSPNLISLNGFKIGNQAVQITANNISKTGNAVIAAYSGEDQTGDILWSWHIWVTDYDPDKGGKTYTVVNSANVFYVFMDRNLGAVSAIPGDNGTIGLHYQWGRKDPFPGSASLSSIVDPVMFGKYTSVHTQVVPSDLSGTNNVNLSNSIKHPEIFYGFYSDITRDWYANEEVYQNNALWGGASMSAPTAKTIFDPCPSGWRVPAWRGNASPWSNFTVDNFVWQNLGRIYDGAYYPASRWWDGYNNCLVLIDNSGAYTNASSCYWKADYGYCYRCCHMVFDDNGVSGSADFGHRADGFSLRCVKE